MSQEDQKKPGHLDLVVYPYRSLKPEHFSKLLLVLIAICTIASIRFSLIGAWPVAVFLLLDLIALWFAFYLNYRRAQIREEIKLSDTKLTIRRFTPKGLIKSWRFEPYWVKLCLVADQARTNRLELSLHDQCVNVGAFLTPGERASLYEELNDALRSWKNR